MTPQPQASTRMLLAVAASTVLSAIVLFAAFAVANLGDNSDSNLAGGGDPMVAGAFVLTAVSLTLAAATLIGLARYVHGDSRDGRPMVRRGMGLLAVFGLSVTASLVVQIDWPYNAAAFIALVPVAVMARDATLD